MKAVAVGTPTRPMSHARVPGRLFSAAVGFDLPPPEAPGVASGTDAVGGGDAGNPEVGEAEAVTASLVDGAGGGLHPATT
jgi:hypothetical protein